MNRKQSLPIKDKYSGDSNVPKAQRRAHRSPIQGHSCYNQCCFMEDFSFLSPPHIQVFRTMLQEKRKTPVYKNL